MVKQTFIEKLVYRLNTETENWAESFQVVDWPTHSNNWQLIWAFAALT